MLLVAVAAVTSLFRLGDRGFWGDEVWTVWWSQGQGWLQSLRRFDAPPDLPLWFLITKTALLVGESTLAARLPAAFFSIGSVVALYVIARPRLGAVTAAGAGLLLATTPLHVWYAQEARPYAALEFLSLVSIAVLLALIARPNWSMAVAYGAICGLNVLNHLMGAFPLLVGVVVALAVAASRWRSGERNAAIGLGRQLILAGIVCAIVLLPVLPGIARYALDQASVSGPAFVPSATFLADLLARFGAGYGPALVLYSSLAALGGVAAVRPDPLLGSLIWALLIVPLLILWLVQPAHHFITRFFLFMLPMYVLAIAHGVVVLATSAAKSRARANSASRPGPAGRALAVLALGALVAVQGPTTAAGYALERGSDWSGMCEYLRLHARPADTVIGTTYYQGTMSWCFDSQLGVIVPPIGAYTAEDLYAAGRSTWFVHIGPEPPDPMLSRLGYVEIPLDQIERPGTRHRVNLPPYSYPRSEGSSRLFRGPSVSPRSEVSLHEVEGSSISPGWPDYAPIPHGRRYMIRISPGTGVQHELRVTHLAQPGRLTIISIDGQEVGRLSTSTDLGWSTSTISLPDLGGAELLLELQAGGRQPSAVSQVSIVVNYPVGP